MTRRFVLSTDPLTADQERQLRQEFGSMGFWHWLPNFWLLKSRDEAMDAPRIMKMVQKVAPSARCFVSQVESIGPWAGLFRPNAQGGDMAGWLRAEWNKP